MKTIYTYNKKLKQKQLAKEYFFLLSFFAVFSFFAHFLFKVDFSYSNYVIFFTASVLDDLTTKYITSINILEEQKFIEIEHKVLLGNYGTKKVAFDDLSLIFDTYKSFWKKNSRRIEINIFSKRMLVFSFKSVSTDLTENEIKEFRDFAIKYNVLQKEESDIKMKFS